MTGRSFTRMRCVCNELPNSDIAPREVVELRHALFGEETRARAPPGAEIRGAVAAPLAATQLSVL